MSKSRYLKASELGISHKELRAFIWTKKLLENGTLEDGRPEGKNFKFDIGETVTTQCLTDHHWCGTAACIGGWVGLKMHAEDVFHPTTDEMNKARNYVSSNLTGSHPTPPKEALFYDNLPEKDTPALAAKAIEGYLTTGKGR